jgi:hypothetical protein
MVFIPPIYGEIWDGLLLFLPTLVTIASCFFFKGHAAPLVAASQKILAGRRLSWCL